MFQRESLNMVREEIAPLLQLHYDEISHYRDIKLDPDWATYQMLEDKNCLRIFTIRSDEKLIGYAAFFVKHSIKYKSSLQATQDVVFVNPANRGIGAKFIRWCDEKLANDGVQVVYHHVKRAHNFGPLLERFGYELVDLIYAKRLDGLSNSGA